MLDNNDNPLQHCYICKKKSNYICPRCKIDYCSIECYKSSQHSQCSESFYKKCVLNEHGLDEKSDQSEKVLIDYYKIFEKELFADAGDEENVAEDLEERLNGINLDDTTKVWNALNENEQEQFKQALKNNEEWLNRLIPLWKPWWKSKVPMSFLVDVDKEHKLLFMQPYEIPQIWVGGQSNYPMNKASPCVPINIINLLFGYTYIARLYNGDYFENALDAFQVFKNITPALLPNCNATSIKEVTYLSLECLMNLPKMQNLNTTENNLPSMLENFSDQILEDVIDIIGGPFPQLLFANSQLAPNEVQNLSLPSDTYSNTSKFNTFYMDAALSSLRLLMLTALKELKSAKILSKENKAQLPTHVEFSADDTNIINSRSINSGFCSTDHELTINLVKKCIKKVEFYLSWLKWFQTGANSRFRLQSWITDLHKESNIMKANIKEHIDTKTMIEQNLGKLRSNMRSHDQENSLIEEL